VSFGELLHRAGVPITPERSGRFAQAILIVDPATTSELYWVARVSLITGREHLDTFDRVFGQVFGGLVDVADFRGDPTSTPAHVRPEALASQTGARPRAGPQGDAVSAGLAGVSRASPSEPDEDRQDVVVGTASRQERLATTDFGDVADDELAELARLMRRLRVAPPLRRGRRRRPHPRGDRLDLRATLRQSRRNGGDPVAQVRRRLRPRPRRVVVLCDISGSMEPYARAYVRFLHAAAGGSRAEVFTFATRLTRLTRALAVAQPQLALARAAATAPDWRGGTRIGDAVKSFLDSYGRRGLARGAVVVLVSDGWERDDPALLGEQMARLHRLAHRVVWVNPRTADPRYAPLTGGMAAALPHCDVVVSGHTLAALDDVVAAIAAG